MSDQPRSTPSVPPTLFSIPFLDYLAERIESPPITLAEADYVGPWRVRHDGDRWLLRSEIHGHVGHLLHRETAAMLAAVLPGVGRPAIYEFDRRKRGVEVMTSLGDTGHTSIGFLKLKDDAIPPALDVAHSILTRPESLAWLLLAADTQIIARVGELVARWVEEGQAGFPPLPRGCGTRA